AHLANLVRKVAAQTYIEPVHVEQDQALVAALGEGFQEFEKLLGGTHLIRTIAAAKFPQRSCPCLLLHGRSLQENLNPLMNQDRTIVQLLGQWFLRLERLF